LRIAASSRGGHLMRAQGGVAPSLRVPRLRVPRLRGPAATRPAATQRRRQVRRPIRVWCGRESRSAPALPRAPTPPAPRTRTRRRCTLHARSRSLEEHEGTAQLLPTPLKKHEGTAQLLPTPLTAAGRAPDSGHVSSERQRPRVFDAAATRPQ
jgi:hypothetical protein